MNHPDYFKLSQDHSLENFNPISSSTERGREVNIRQEGVAAAEGAHGSSVAQTYQNADPTQVNMQSQEEQGNASNDHSLADAANNAAISAGDGSLL